MLKKEWRLLPEINEKLKEQLQNLDSILAQLLFNRGLTTPDEMADFLHPSPDRVFDPFLFRQMTEAVEPIISHIKAGSKITIYGDYDADGVTSLAVLYETFQALKAEVAVYIPHRVSEGYGLNKKAVDTIFSEGSKLIVTVDGGIRNREEVAYAKSLGMDVVITDHHPAAEDGVLPECLVINPAVLEESYPFKYLAGVGVAFKLASALISRAKLEDKYKKMLERRVLYLVAIGTVSDCVRLVGENRLLLADGLKALNSTRRLGLKVLIKSFSVSEAAAEADLESWNIGFQIGPRLNAAGRMEHANTAFALLVTKDKKEAERSAQDLNGKNTHRQRVTEKITAEVVRQVEDKADDKIAIGVCSDSDEAWNEGVVGLVAGKIVEKYYKPALVITKTSEGYKGSGRSILEFNLIGAIEECSDFLDKYGGHPSACGFSFFEDKLDGFLSKIREIARRDLSALQLVPKIEIDCELKIAGINEKTVEKIRTLAPFGQNNPLPRFVSYRELVRDVSFMGQDGQHIKFRLGNFWAVAFGGAEEWGGIQAGDLIDLVYHLDFNDFNGRRSIQLKVVDLRKSE